MKVTLKLPRLSSNMQEATIAAWHRQTGESFSAGEPLYAVETEKVTADVEAPCAGRLLEILMPTGSNGEVGDQVCIIDKTDG